MSLPEPLSPNGCVRGPESYQNQNNDPVYSPASAHAGVFLSSLTKPKHPGHTSGVVHFVSDLGMPTILVYTAEEGIE